ncbi:MAG: type IV secretory system conjugative DNA transfer family protein [Patescibacteria group bacterium]
MKFFEILFHPFVVVPVLVLLFGFLGFLFWKYRKDTIFKHSLKFSLYEISFPRTKKDERPFKETVAIMEQFYSGMSEFKPHFVLEIASPATENETNFYASVPRDKASFFENQVRSVFPMAEIREEKSDYNIFKYKAVSAGATVSLKHDFVLPIKTYDLLGADPLEVVVNTFSSFARDKEGAALQIVIDPGETGFNRDIEKAIKRLQSGEPLETALKGGESLTKSFLKVVSGGLIHSEQKVSGALPREEIIGLLNQKISKRVMRANIRLVVSAQTEQRAQEILSEMKSVFSQFSNPQGNSFNIIDLKGRRLKKFFYDFSFRLFNEENSLYLNTAELTSVYHFPFGGLSAPRMKFAKTRNVEPPISLSKEGVLLGKNNFRDSETNIYLASEDRRRHLYLIGQTGTGKSALMKNMVVQDIKKGNGVCFIDPHGSDIQDVLGQIPEERWEDVIYFDPSDVTRPFGLNMLEYDPAHPEQKTFIVNELLEIFDKLYDMSTAGGPMFEQYFRNATLLVMEDPESGNTLLEISRILSDKQFRDYKLSKCNNPVLKNFWTEMAEKAGGEASLQNIVPYITSKFDTFLSNEIMRPIIAQEKSSFNFRNMMDNNKILLVNLSKGKLGDLNANLLGMVIVGKLFMAAMSRVDVPENERKDFYFYIDEFQNITTKTISMILSEARKYRLDLTIAHQFIGQLDEDIKKAVFGNVGSIGVFRIGKEDAEFLAKHFEPVFSEEDLMNLANYNAYLKLLVNGETSMPFNTETFSPGESLADTASKVKEISALKYGRPLSQVESEINKRYLNSTG